MLILKVNNELDECPFQKSDGCVILTTKLGVKFGKACVGVVLINDHSVGIDHPWWAVFSRPL